MEDFFQNTTLTEPVLRVRHLEPMLRFYGGALGFRVIHQTSRRAELSATGAGPALLILEEDASALDRPRGAAGLFHLAYLYPDRGALATALRRVVEHEYPLQGASDHGVSEALYLADPEGNGLELYRDRPSAEWPRKEGRLRMFTAPLDLRALFREATPTGDSYSLPPATRLGHVHLSVSELDATEELFARRLGFTVQERDFPGALFFGRDGYHHHIGANTWQSHRPAPVGVLGLQEFTIRRRDSAPSETVAFDGFRIRLLQEPPA